MTAAFLSPPSASTTATIDAPPTSPPAPSSGPSSDPAPLGIARTRVALLLVAYIAVAGSACRIFDQIVVTLLTAPVLPAVAIMWGAGRRPSARLASTAAAVLASAAIATIATGGGLGDLGDLPSGFQGLLSTEWPSPTRPALVGAVALTLAVATAVSSELAIRRRFHLLPALPLIVVELATIAPSAPAGVGWASVVVVSGVTTAIALLRNEGDLRERLVLVRGERNIMPFLAVVVALVVLLVTPLALPDRADPRRQDPPQRTAALLDPIEATLALRALDPPVDLHVVTADGGEPLPGRWRTAALSDYDGDRWLPDLTLRPIGETLGPATDAVIDVDIEFLVDDLSLVPLPGPPIAVGAEVETDPDRTVVRLVEQPEPGDVVPVVAAVTPTEPASPPAIRLIDDDVSTLVSLAEALAGDGTPSEQLDTLETVLREGDEFVLDSEVSGGGLQRAFIEIFLRDTRRGNREQFVTGFVLLARALGVDARVATGFVTEPTGGGTLRLTSADALVWPEVRLDDGTWIAYDPVPDEEVVDDDTTPPRPQTQTPSAPQPPIAPPPEPDTEDDEPPAETETDAPSAFDQALTWGLRAAAGVGVVLLPFLVAAVVILGLKLRRRRRRMRAESATERVRGAWATATDGLVDAGVTIGRSATDAEIATDGEVVVVESRADLHRLASLSSTATFGTLAHPELMADDAARCLSSVERSITLGQTRRQRWRWRLSLRSLRRSTRSPLSG